MCAESATKLEFHYDKEHEICTMVSSVQYLLQYFYCTFTVLLQYLYSFVLHHA